MPEHKPILSRKTICRQLAVKIEAKPQFVLSLPRNCLAASLAI